MACSFLSVLLVSSIRKLAVSPGAACVVICVVLMFIVFGSGFIRITASIIAVVISAATIAPISITLRFSDICLFGFCAQDIALLISVGEYPAFISVVLMVPAEYPNLRSLVTYSVRLSFAMGWNLFFCLFKCL